MTTEELRAAAERLTANCWDTYLTASPEDRNWELIFDKVLGDGRNVARAYLNPWRPIESAPRDGTKFVGYWPGGGEWQVAPVGVRLTWYWRVGNFGEFAGFDTIGPQPTLWTPLPCAPLPRPPAPAA
jgi:hypothetical protein